MQFSKDILLIISFVVIFTACRSDQSSNNAPRPSETAQPAQAAQPSVSPSPAQQKATVDQKTEAKVPDSMKRPLTAAEMEKAFQQLPSSARAQIQGMAPAPAEVRKRQKSNLTANPAVK